MFKRATNVIKSNFKEFTEFAFKGNLLQLAIGVVLGTAFGDLIKSFVNHLFLPLINLVTGGGNNPASYARWEWKGIQFGLFIGQLISFVIIAMAIFILMVKVVGWIVKLTKKRGEASPEEAVAKECPFCLSTIPIKATKCAHCTSDVAHTVPAV